MIPASCLCTCLKFTILWFQDQQRDYTEKKTTGTGVLLHYGIVHEINSAGAVAEGGSCPVGGTYKHLHAKVREAYLFQTIISPSGGLQSSPAEVPTSSRVFT